MARGSATQAIHNPRTGDRVCSGVSSIKIQKKSHQSPWQPGVDELVGIQCKVPVRKRKSPGLAEG